MLEYLRSSVNSIVGKFIIALLVIAFAVWGINDFVNGRGGNVVASVGKERVSINLFANQLRQAIRLQGGALGAEEIREQGIADLTLTRLTTGAALDAEIAALGLAMPDKAVIETISKQEQFHGDSGTFDQQEYKRILRSNDISEIDYEDSTRKDLARNALLAALAGGATMPTIFADTINLHSRQTLKVDYIILGKDQVDAPPIPDEATLRNYMAANEADFTAPEYRNVTFIDISPKTLARPGEIADSETKKLYNDRKDKYHVPEKRFVEQIFLANEEDAKAALERAQENTSFPDIAKTHGKNPDAVSLGFIARDDLIGVVQDAVFNLPEPGFVGPLDTPFGWGIFNIRNIQPENITTYEEAKAELAQELAEKKASHGLTEASFQAEDFIAEGKSLEEAAAALGIKAHAVTIDDLGFDPKGLGFDTLPNTPDFLTHVFEVTEDELPSLIEADEDQYFALKLNKVTPPHLRDFDKIRPQIHLAWKNAQISEALAQKASLYEGGKQELSAVATEIQLPLNSLESVVRGRATSDLPVELINALFKAEPGDTLSRAVENRHILAQLKEKVMPEEAQLALASQFIRAQSEQTFRNDVVEVLANAALERYGSSVNSAAISAAIDAVAR